MLTLIQNQKSASLRIIMYSHDTLGMGHFRRNLIIARSLVQSGLADNILLINSLGSSSSLVVMPHKVGCLTLPRLLKKSNELYSPRTLNMSLEELLALRSAIILATVKSFNPDLFIVDNVARGVGYELDDTLHYLDQNHHSRCVLGLRDIVDDALTVHTQWHLRKSIETMRDYYDQIWVYGDISFFDTIQEYNLPEDIALKLRFTGYFNRRQTDDSFPAQEQFNAQREALNRVSEKLVLCMAGGGQDGAFLTRTFSRVTLPPDYHAIILIGPDMPAIDKNYLQSRLCNKPNWKLVEFHHDPVELLQRASAVISMGGYNSISEILSFGIPSLIVPRVTPRKEQQIRASRLKEMKLIELCYPDQLTPEVIDTWLQNIDQDRPIVGSLPDFNGATRLPELAAELCRNNQGTVLKDTFN